MILKESPLVRGPSQITIPVCIKCLQGLEEFDIKPDQQCERCGWPICYECSKSQSEKNMREGHLQSHHDECDITIARGNKFSLQHYFNPRMCSIVNVKC